MADQQLFRHVDTADPGEASVRVDLDSSAEWYIKPMLFGKFCEHLGNNIYHGMEAQILFNPVLGEWHFRADQRRPSGGYVSESDPDHIREVVETHGRPLAYPEETDPDALLDAYRNGFAFGWQPTDENAVAASPDTGPSGGRAQRLEVDEDDEGISQKTRLPLHRTDDYEFRIRARATTETTLGLTVCPADSYADTRRSVSVDVGTDWSTVEGTVSLPSDIPPDAVYDVAVTAPEGANVVVERVLLYPDDHVDHADPDVVEFLRESDLPLLRWPGGNFVSGYHWRDGVGPVDDRPTRVNPAWGGLEYNLFGTTEFVEFCENVGCEPSICVNAGDGTPEEAAAWVEYCNGDPDESEMGSLRAEHGYEEPFDITYWEIGNELYGEWQVNWTTPEGNADRYERFREAMRNADPDIEVTACGWEMNNDGRWNDALLEECGDDVRAISEHILGGGQVDAETDPDELFHAFMGFSDQIGREFGDLRERMERAGIDDPKLDVTELQLFANFQTGVEGAGREGRHATGGAVDEDEKLSPETMPTPTTISEALYDAVIRHEFIRMGEFVEMLTHSATVNHGGGLWKEGERVWANPCHYGRSIGSALVGKTPVAVDVTCDTISTKTTFREIEPVDDVPALDVMAAVDDGDELVIMVVNRASGEETTELTIDVGGVGAAPEGNLTTLSGESMYDENTRDEPTRIAPESSTVDVTDGELELELDPYSMVRVTVPFQ